MDSRTKREIPPIELCLDYIIEKVPNRRDINNYKVGEKEEVE
jgi:hypothetical protein